MTSLSPSRSNAIIIAACLIAGVAGYVAIGKPSMADQPMSARQAALGLADLQDQQAAARLEHAQHRADGIVLVRHVAQAEGDGHHVEVVIREGQLLGVGLDEADVAGHALVEQTITADAQHRFVDIGQHHFAGRAD